MADRDSESWQAGYTAGVEATSQGITILVESIKGHPDRTRDEILAEFESAAKMMPKAAKIFGEAFQKIIEGGV